MRPLPVKEDSVVGGEECAAEEWAGSVVPEDLGQVAGLAARAVGRVEVREVVAASGVVAASVGAAEASAGAVLGAAEPVAGVAIAPR
jgi:hypothetical protein